LETSDHSVVTDYYGAASFDYIETQIKSFFRNGFNLIRGEFEWSSGVTESFNNFDEFFEIISRYSPPTNSKGL
jgi:hypothetical protein